MDPGTPKPSTTPAAGTVAEPYHDRPAFSDTFLDPPLQPDELGRLSHYRVLAELGRGGMGVVYRAEDADLRRPVAVKVMLPGSAADARAVARFRREAEAQAKVDHAHVVPIYSVGESNGVAFLVMPLLKGMTLAAALRLTPRPPLSAVVRIGVEIASGLSAAHELGLIHRDIKPANVWLEAPKWRVKILDFGLARASGEAGAAPGPTLTATGAIMGTPAYMSPEQARTQPTDFRSDLFSLGVVLYEMATGQRPFTGASTFDVMAATVGHHPPPAHERNPDVPRPLSELIGRLMAKAPADRPVSAEAVAEQLDAIGRGLTARTGATTPPGGAPTEPDVWGGLAVAPTDTTQTDATRADATDFHVPPRRGRWLLWSLAAVPLVLVAVAALALGGRSKPTAPTTWPGPSADVSHPPAEPPKPEPPKPEPDHEREAAEKLVPFARLRLRVQRDGEPKLVDVFPGGQLPAGRFTVTVIDFDDTDGKVLNAAFVANVFLPAVSQLRGLAEVRSDGWQIRLTGDHVRRMAGMPLADTLRMLSARVDLTPDALTDLKIFRALTQVVFDVPEPSDELFVGLAELTQLRRVVFCRPSRRPELTHKGWDAIAGMRLEAFTLFAARGAPDALRALAARPGPLPALEFWECRDLTDDALAAHLKPTTDVRRLVFRWSELTNASVPTLAAVKSLREIEFQATRITQKGSQALFDARPDINITYSLKP